MKKGKVFDCSAKNAYLCSVFQIFNHQYYNEENVNGRSSSIEEDKQQLKESLESLKKTLMTEKNYTLEFYLTNENDEKVYSLYLIVKNGEIIVSEELP